MALKPVPKENKGLGKLPTKVRNKMGYMKKGGRVMSDLDRKLLSKTGKTMSDSDRKLKKEILGESGKTISNADRARVKKMFGESGKSISDADRKLLSEIMGRKKPKGMEKGGRVRPGLMSDLKSSKAKRLVKEGFKPDSARLGPKVFQITGKKYAGLF
ncbi:MAG: hypothetical protein CBC24_08320 [Candidatus Pelagibacter sp. TMED64]|jgi:hypothetical protein|nr:MAG: hypothetical protein CBC24_08320 [Candidatus Pelagibacter sp. TMED64]|tara:strand:- start:229 stop:702 length:474 start_codon:yes stop_codon:yes gene_type:complete